MPTGSADERMAFVLETEAKLDGVRQARAEITGVGTDTDALSARLSQMSETSRASFEKLTAAEKQAVAGFIGLKAGADQATDAVSRNTAQLVAHNRALTDRQLENRRATLAMMGLSKADIDAATAVDTHAGAAKRDEAAVNGQTAAIEKSTVAILRQRQAAEAAAQASIPRSPAAYAGAANALNNPMLGPALPPGGLQVIQQANAKTAASFDQISPKARSAANAISMLTLAASSGGGSAQGMAIAAGTLTSSLAHLSSSATIAASASGIGALVVVAATVIPLLMRMRDASEQVSGSFQRTIALADESTAGVFLKIAQARKEAALRALEESPTGLLGLPEDKERKRRQQAVDDAIKDEEAAIAQVFTARRNKVRKERADALAEEQKARQEALQSRGLGEEMRGRTIQLGLERTAPELAAVTGIQMQQAQRDEAIDKMTTLSQEERDRRKIESARQAQAEINKVYDDAAEKRIAKAIEEANKTDAIEKAKAAKRLDIAKQNVHAIVTTEGSILQTMRRLALQPIVDRLEGIAAAQAVEALASFPDFAAMAAHGAAALAATAAAREVAGWMGGGGRGGGSAAGSGGGGTTSTFEPRSGTGTGGGVMALTIITQNPLGPDHIQNLSFELNRAGILRRPIVQLPPTTGITVSAA